jgi:hypothetical protein
MLQLPIAISLVRRRYLGRSCRASLLGHNGPLDLQAITSSASEAQPQQKQPLTAALQQAGLCNEVCV